MAEFKIGRLRFTWAGAWEAGHFYNRDAVSQYNGKAYVCLIPHTSNSDFYHDLNFVTPAGASTPYWTLMTEGKTWKGAWTPSTVYSTGNIVIYGGTTYTCSTQHTSASDFDATKWTIYVLSDKWNSNWAISTSYGLGDIVRYGGIVYRCITNHVSASTTALGLEADQEKWAVVYSGIDYKGDWASTTRYKLNDLVRVGPNLYISTINHTSGSSVNPSNWTLWIPGLELNNAWNSSFAYQPGEIAVYGGYSYVSNTINNINNIPSTDSVDWSLLTKGYNLKGDWSSSLSYKIGDVVRRNGALFNAVKDNSQQDPTSYAVSTTLEETQYTWNISNFSGTVIQGPPGTGGFNAAMTFSVPPELEEIVNEWAEGQFLTITINGTTTNSYSVLSITPTGPGAYTAVFDQITTDYGTVTEIVFSSPVNNTNIITVGSTTGLATGMNVIGAGFTQGQTVVAVLSPTSVKISAPSNALTTAGQDIEFVGVNYINWSVIIPGNQWRQVWQSTGEYSIGDIALWQNGTYVCNQRHSSSTSTRPDLDTDHTYWAPYALHDRKNALESLGDIIENRDGINQAVHISSQDLILKNTGSNLSWQTLNIVPNVYYVTPDGEDRADWGLTWDQSWKTVKYACEFVGAGTVNPNTRDLLNNNRDWMVEQMYQYMLYQMDTTGFPFSPSSVFEEAATKRDASYLVDALAYDISRGGNSQTVAAALAYFELGSSGKFFNTATEDAMPYIIASLTQLKSLINNAITQTEPTTDYAVENEYDAQYSQVFGPSAEINVVNSVNDLVDLVIDALTAQSTVDLPVPNQGCTATIMVKTGTYSETLPIVVPENVALSGDELRGVVVQPAIRINTLVTASNALTHRFTVKTTEGMTEYTPVQFTNRTVNGVTSTIGGVEHGRTYYVIGSSITPTQFAVSETASVSFLCDLQSEDSTIRNISDFTDVAPGTPVFATGIPVGTRIATVDEVAGTATLSNASTVTIFQTGIRVGVELTAGSGSSALYGGDAIKNMFLCRNGSGVRNMTLSGLLGTISTPNQFNTSRPTGGAFVSLDPGTGTNDTKTWIFRRSPYAQNVTMFGQGCTGMKIDGRLHAGGNKSIVANDFTTILSDGIGAWCTGPDALTELVSVFNYYGYAGYFAEDGGRIRATNGNSSYGTFGTIAEGYDDTEVPITGNIYNRSQQVQAQVQSSFGSNAQLLRLNFSNSGGGYYQTTTNLLNYSNVFDNTSGWTTDGNITLAKNTEAPNGNVDAWRFTGTNSVSGDAYIYQDLSIQPAGATYTGLTAVNITGQGGVFPNTPATFNITVTSTSYVVTVNSGGSGYVSGNTMFISGAQLGGLNNINDCIIEVDSLAGSSILTVIATGTVPAKSNLSYTLSTYVKQGTASSIDISGVFSGSSDVTSTVNFNFASETITPSNSGGPGFVPTQYGAVNLHDGWYRVWFALNDITGLNSSLRFKMYPRGINGTANTYTHFFGAQAERSSSTFAPSFYLDVAETETHTAYADFNFVGAGTGVTVIGDELRSKSVFETRVTDPGSGAGGSGYLTASNNAQSGDTEKIQLAQSDINTASNYVGMRVFINSGFGAGQYGYISSYEPSSKFAQVLKESFDPLIVSNTSSSGNLITLNPAYNTETMYINQKIQFIPTYYTLGVDSISLSTQTVQSTIGGTTNTLTVPSTTQLTVNMPVFFDGTLFGGLTENYTYYISEILDEFTIRITAQLFGTAQPLLTTTPVLSSMFMNFPANTNYIAGSTTNMSVNLPVQFTGTSVGGVTVGETYYINDVINSGNFTISSALVTVSPSATDSSTNSVTVPGGTSGLTSLNPIVFSGNVFGNIVEGTKYYISKIINSNTFSITESLIVVDASATEFGSNLITVTDTTGFVANNPIVFIGTIFGGIVAETVYYILAINNSTTFTISQTPGGSAVTLQDSVGLMYAKTAPTPFQLQSAAGSMSGTTTASKTKLTSGKGSLNATFSTTLFGNVVQGTTYYVKTIDDVNNQITISNSLGGGTLALATKSGSMNIGAVGWDHVNIGTPNSPSINSSSVYYIEPRTTYTDPPFSQIASTPVNLAPGTFWTDLAYGNNYWIALPSGNATAMGSPNGESWTSITLPQSDTWSRIAYGNGYFVAITANSAGNSIAARTPSNGLGWRTTNLPNPRTWTCLTYGNGKFIAVASTGQATVSVDYGKTWSSENSTGITAVVDMAYGADKFVAISSSGTAAYSTDGITWTTITMPAANTWTSIAYGSNRFVVVSSDVVNSLYSFDTIDWYESSTPIEADIVVYGHGVFVTLSNVNSTSFTSEGGLDWKIRTVTDDQYTTAKFGFTSSDKLGIFVTLAGESTGSVISAGCRTKSRPIVTSGVITSMSQWESGSGYNSPPTVTFTDPNVTRLAVVTPRLGNSSLGNPTFVNRGTGYNNNSTVVTINGNGYSDAYQIGLTLIMNNLTRLPSPGDNLEIDGDSNVYKVTSATVAYGTVAPNIEANVQIAPDMSVANSPAGNTPITIRQKYSQVRLTGHDFLNVGYGTETQSNYPGLPSDTELQPQNQTVEVNYGRVFYTSTDQDGNFKVGSLFGVQQATGIVTLSASQFGLTGLETLSLGGIAVGGSSVVVSQFSTDSTFIANSDNIVPTQKAIKSYLTSRLSQGGANTFTGQLIAGTVLIGGADKISSTIPNGVVGSVVNMPNKVNFTGEFAGVDGGMAAYSYFVFSSSHK